MDKNHVLMIYPKQGFSGTYVKHMPLGLLYASSEIIKTGYDVSLLDMRIIDGDWRAAISKKITGEGHRVFLMAPLHHHFEHKGKKDIEIVQNFWL